jgi:cytochrome bd-type quinol oxidase subunit 2
VVVNLLIFAFVYIWTQSAQKSLIVSALFAIPYYLIFIGMESERFGFLARIPRSFIIEALAVAAIVWAIFRQVSDQPLLNDDAGFWLLFLSSIPLIAHAQISAIWPNASRKETIS